MAYNNSSSVTNTNLIGLDKNKANELAKQIVMYSEVVIGTSLQFLYEIYDCLMNENGWHTQEAHTWTKNNFIPSMHDSKEKIIKIYRAFFSAVVNDIDSYAKAIGSSESFTKTLEKEIYSNSQINLNPLFPLTNNHQALINTKLPEIVKQYKSKITAYKTKWTSEFKNLRKYNPVMGSDSVIEGVYNKACATLNMIEQEQMGLYNKLLKKVTDEVAKMQEAANKARNAANGK